MSASFPLTKHMRLLCLNKSTGQLAKGIEKMRCRAMRFAWGYEKLSAIAATPLQYASAGDSPQPHLHWKFTPEWGLKGFNPHKTTLIG